jgi:hypothetical protein
MAGFSGLKIRAHQHAVDGMNRQDKFLEQMPVHPRISKRNPVV